MRPQTRRGESRRLGSRWLDPGWLFVIAGVAMTVAVTLIPARNDLDSLRRQLRELQQEEAFIAARLRAHANFLDALERGDPTLVKRLIAAQLNLVPQGEQPVLLVKSSPSSVTEWIDDTVREDRTSPLPAPPSRLSRLADGRYRLWLLGGSMLCIYTGLVMGIRPRATPAATSPDHRHRRNRRRRPDPHHHPRPRRTDLGRHPLLPLLNNDGGDHIGPAASVSASVPPIAGGAAMTADNDLVVVEEDARADGPPRDAAGAADDPSSGGHHPGRDAELADDDRDAAEPSSTGPVPEDGGSTEPEAVGDPTSVADEECDEEAGDENHDADETCEAAEGEIIEEGDRADVDDGAIEHPLDSDEQDEEEEDGEDEVEARDEDEVDAASDVAEDVAEDSVEDDVEGMAEDVPEDEVADDLEADEDAPEIEDEEAVDVDHDVDEEEDEDEDAHAEDAEDADAEDEDEDEDADECEYQYVYVDEDGNPIAEENLDEYDVVDE